MAFHFHLSSENCIFFFPPPKVPHKGTQVSRARSTRFLHSIKKVWNYAFPSLDEILQTWCSKGSPLFAHLGQWHWKGKCQKQMIMTNQNVSNEKHKKKQLVDPETKQDSNTRKLAQQSGAWLEPMILQDQWSGLRKYKSIKKWWVCPTRNC